MSTKNEAKTEAKATEKKEQKEKKPPVPAVKRISDQLKRAAVTSKITKDELTQIETLAKSLAVFVS